MIKRIIFTIVKDLGTYNNYTQTQIEQINYTLTVLVFEFIKLTSIVFFFLMAGYFKESLLILFLMSLTKPFIGGYHEDTQFKCFIATILLVACIIILSKNTSLNLLCTVILNLISIFCIYNQAPIINNKMPITKEHLIKRNRIIGVTISTIFALISILFFKAIWFSNIIVWTLMVQAIFMFNKYEKVRR